MSKKDRIAIVCTVLYLFWPLSVAVSGKIPGAIIWLIPPVLYWGYRFIRGDISFFKNDPERSK